MELMVIGRSFGIILTLHLLSWSCGLEVVEAMKVDALVEVVVESKLTVVTGLRVVVVVASVVVVGSWMFIGWHTIKAFIVLKRAPTNRWFKDITGFIWTSHAFGTKVYKVKIDSLLSKSQSNHNIFTPKTHLFLKTGRYFNLYSSSWTTWTMLERKWMFDSVDTSFVTGMVVSVFMVSFGKVNGMGFSLFGQTWKGLSLGNP